MNSSKRKKNKQFYNLSHHNLNIDNDFEIYIYSVVSHKCTQKTIYADMNDFAFK